MILKHAYKIAWHWNLFLFCPDISIGCRNIETRRFRDWERDNEWIEWPTFFPRNAYYFSRNRVCLSRIWDAHESEKITLLFTRRYLESRKWYRDKRKTALKYKISRFQRSLTRWPEVISFEVTTIQSFSNFNRIKRSRITGEKLLFLSFSSNEDRRFEVFLILFSFKENHFLTFFR